MKKTLCLKNTLMGHFMKASFFSFFQEKQMHEITLLVEENSSVSASHVKNDAENEASLCKKLWRNQVFSFRALLTLMLW